LLITDAWRANSIKDKLRIWFMPTGWRPADVVEKYPVYKIDDIHNFDKYNTKDSTLISILTWIQLMMLFAFVSYFLGHLATIGSPNIFIYGGFIFIYIYALTDFMDGNKSSLIWEFLKAATGIAILIYLGDWFGTSNAYLQLSNILLAYFTISVIVTGWLVYKKEPTLIIN